MNFSDIDSHTPSDDDGFSYSVELLEYHAHDIPLGWQSIYGDCIQSLKAVDCQKRAHLRLRPPNTDLGLLSVDWLEDDPSRPDHVVRGILRKMRDRSKCTCELCGRPAVFLAILRLARTLCPRCAVRREMQLAVDDLLWRLRSKRALSTMEPVVALSSLPLSLREMIPPDFVRKLVVSPDTRGIDYITKESLTTMRPTLERVHALLQSMGECQV